MCRRNFAADQIIRYGENYVCESCKPAFLQSFASGGIPVLQTVQYGGFWVRFVAKVIDWAIIYIVTLIAVAAMKLLVNLPDLESLIVGYLISTVIGMAYPIIFLGHWSQTVGKMALNLKVITEDDKPLTYWKATARVFAESLSGCLLCVGYLVAAFDPEKRALHDIMAKTRVIRTT
jgi:uncharacterized RDD family membrane protein YckC